MTLPSKSINIVKYQLFTQKYTPIWHIVNVNLRNKIRDHIRYDSIIDNLKENISWKTLLSNLHT